MKFNQKILSVVIPSYNEGEQIERTLRELIDNLDKTGLSYEILVIDDGSTDNTALIAKEMGANIVIRNKRTLGKGSAIKAGTQNASGSIIVITDADSTYNPKDIPKLIQPIVEGKAEVSVGSRFMSPAHFSFSRLRIKLIDFLVGLILGRCVSDVFSGFRAYKAEVILKLLDIPSSYLQRFELVNMLAMQRGYKIVEVPVDFRPRESFGYSRSKLGKKPFRVLFGLLKVSLSKKPPR